MKASKRVFFICVFLFFAVVFTGTAESFCAGMKGDYFAAYTNGGHRDGNYTNGNYSNNGYASGTYKNKSYANGGYESGSGADNTNGSGARDTNGNYANENFSPGADTYYIDDANGLSAFAELVSGGDTFAGKTVFLTDDIDFTAFSAVIGRADRPFSGIFDGGENRIYVSAPLFFVLDGGAVKNLFIDAEIIDGSNAPRGILANVIKNSTVKNTAVNVRYINDSNTGNFGGITARLENSTVENCAVKGLIKKEDGTVGGIAACAENSSIINCYNNALIDISYLSEYAAGGIAGRAVSSRIEGCVNYAEIILKPFVEGIDAPGNGAAGLLAGIADGDCALSKSYFIDLPDIFAAGAFGDGGAVISDCAAYTEDAFKSAEFLTVLNLAAGADIFRSDLAGYEENGGFPIFTFQIPKPAVVLSKIGSGEIRVNGVIADKNFKAVFGEKIMVSVKADAYYTIKKAEFNGDAISAGGEYEISFTTDAIYERSVLSVEFEKEMRRVVLDGISAAKVYDGTTVLDLSHLTFGENGLFIKNPYFQGDAIYIENDFTGGDPISASFGYPDADTEGQCIILKNVKFGGAGAEFYDIPAEFRIYAAKISKAELTVYYGGIDGETMLYTKGAAKSVYGDAVTDGKYFGMSVSDENLMLSGELFVEILENGIFRPLSDDERLQAGEYVLRPFGLSAKNYDITFEECVLTVIKRELFVSFGYAETEYGTPPVFSFTFSNFAFGEGAEVLTTPPSLDGSRLLAGTHMVTLSGGRADNYTVVNVGGEIKVNKKRINASIDVGQCKIYGEAEPLLTAYSDGLCYGDAIKLFRAEGEGAARYSYTGYMIEGGGADVGCCYTVDITNADERFEIKRRELTILAEDVTAVYGGRPSYKFSYINLAPNETGHDISALKMNVFAAADIEMTVPLTSPLNAGEYIAAPYGGVNDNYIISYTPGRLTVEKSPINFAFSDLSIVYGSVIAPAYTASGFQYNQGCEAIDFGGMTIRIEGVDGVISGTPDVGVYAFFADGLFAENYYFIVTAGRLTVVKASLTISIKNPVEGTYGNDLDFEYVFEGFAAGDGADALLNLRAEYALTTEIQTATPYAEAKNYALTFVGNYLKLNKRTLTIEGAAIADKLFDGTDAAVIVGEPYLSGAVFGDELTLGGVLTAVFEGVSAGINIPVRLGGAVISGQNAHMYELSYPKLYGNISINTVSAEGITVFTDGLFPSDSSLSIEFLTDYSKIGDEIKKYIGSAKVYYAFDAEIFSDSGRVIAGAKYYIRIPLTGDLDVKNLRAVVYAADGRYADVKTYVQDGYIIVESGHLGRVALVKGYNFFPYITLAALLCAIAAVLFLYKKGKLGMISGKPGKAARCNSGAAVADVRGAAVPGTKGYGIFGEHYNGAVVPEREGYKNIENSYDGTSVSGTKDYGISGKNYNGADTGAVVFDAVLDIPDGEYEEFINEAIGGVYPNVQNGIKDNAQSDRGDNPRSKSLSESAEASGIINNVRSNTGDNSNRNANDGILENSERTIPSEISDDEYQSIINEITDDSSPDDAK
ncbi:MAG: YDG domain-containing protein [Clostridiales bacterium]|jgi:hypothetical protein|nr:YDG domain-containing protein [Clostridiales bacterium]